MIELEYTPVIDPAVAAARLTQVPLEKVSAPGAPALARSLGLLPMTVAAIPEVGTKAVAAVALTLVAGAVELFDRQLTPAATAALGLTATLSRGSEGGAGAREARSGGA